MRIEAYNNIQQVYSSRKKAQVAEAVKTQVAADNLEISPIGKDYVFAKNSVNAAPDVRKDVVEPIKEKMQAGTYDVSAADLASKLLGE